MSTNPVQQFTDAVSEKISIEKLKEVLKKVVEQSTDNLREKTPVKWTGNVKASWVTEELTDGFQIKNTNVVMLYLEKGTKAHGPVTAKRLYIPLKPEAAQWSKGLKFGVDFVLAKRVKGIRALNIVRDEIPVLSDNLAAQFKILFAN